MHDTTSLRHPETSTKAAIHGTVSRGWEPVRDAFRENFLYRREVGAACGVYFQGEKVVDLWGGLRDPERGDPWQEDTMVVVFSTTKGIASIALAHANARGFLDYDERVATYWPEFGRNGKATVTVRQLMSHQAGLPALDAPLDVATMADPDRVAQALERQAPAWTPGEHHGYHAITLGWYEGEILRRVDPAHRTIGAYLREEIAKPLGLDLHIGLPDSIPASRIAVLQAKQFRLRMLVNGHKAGAALVLASLNPRSLTSRAFAASAGLAVEDMNIRENLRLQLPASNGVARPRDVARLYGELAIGGGALGIGQRTLDALEQPARAPSQGSFDLVLKREMTYGLGVCKPSSAFRFGHGPRAYGTMGLGGSFGYADPDLAMGFGYAPNRLDFYVYQDPRELALSRAAERCAAEALGR